MRSEIRQKVLCVLARRAHQHTAKEFLSLRFVLGVFFFSFFFFFALISFQMDFFIVRHIDSLRRGSLLLISRRRSSLALVLRNVNAVTAM